MILEIDNDRFEEQRVGGIKGYYDKYAKVFIPEYSFNALLEEVTPKQSRILDAEDIIKSQRRVISNIESKYLDNDTYAQIFLMHLSHSYLLRNSNKKDMFAILYIDIVGSTALTAIMAQEQVAKLVRTFCQEMSLLLAKHNGYVLKYAGDAVIGYFPSEPSVEQACNNAIYCAYNMRIIIERSINEVLFHKKMPKIKARISIDAGYNQIIVLGSEPDMLGHVISRASKIMSKAKPNQIVIGDDVYKHISDDLRSRFILKGSYKLQESSEDYPVYVSREY